MGGSTGLAWGHGGLTVAPPAGNLWAWGDSRARFAPSGYEALRTRLEETNRITYSVIAPCAQKRAGNVLPRHSCQGAYQPHIVDSKSPRADKPFSMNRATASPRYRRSSYHSGRSCQGKLSVPSRHSLPTVKLPTAHSGGLLLPGVSGVPRSARRQDQ